MSESIGFFVAVVALWLAVGLVLSLVMGHRGHDKFTWLVMGTLLGPLAIVLAFASSRDEGKVGPTTPGGATRDRSAGTVEVLVGHDGSPEAVAVLEAAIKLFGPRLGRLTLATVVAFDGGAEAEPRAEEALRRVAGLAQVPSAEVEVLHGRPAEALRRRAAEGGYDLLAVGTRGKGLAHAVLGSTATELARTSKVPVLMVGPSTTET